MAGRPKRRARLLAEALAALPPLDLDPLPHLDDLDLPDIAPTELTAGEWRDLFGFDTGAFDPELELLFRTPYDEEPEAHEAAEKAPGRAALDDPERRRLERKRREERKRGGGPGNPGPGPDPVG